MSERAREPLFFEDTEEVEPEPATESAGSGGSRTAVGGGLADRGGEDEPPIEFDIVPGDDPGGESASVERHLGTAISLMHQVYSMPIEKLGLSTRAYNGLRQGGLITVGHVLKKTEAELLSLRNFGRRSYQELRRKLDEFGIIPDDTRVN
jgi:Bacterial RNA polymerase, alpha chain C terminal domain